MNKSIKSYIFFSFFLLIGIFLFSSCRKTKDTTAIITVRDKSSNLVVGAWVRVFGNSTTTNTSIINDSLQSDYKGEVILNYNKIFKSGQAGVAVLDITGRKGALYGKGIIKIEPEVENTETIFIQ
jgi:hypothetical protein